MTSTDDPDRDRRPSPLIPTRRKPKSPRARSHVSVNWSAAARREYSLVAAASASATRAEIGKAARQAVRRTLSYLAEAQALKNSADATTFTVELTFVSDAEMQELNSNYRGKNKPTDVLSFAQTEGEAFPIAAEEVLLGDVIIAIGTAQRQAAELKHSLSHEIAFLAIHGTLHLCGFDHDTSPRRRVMWKHQDTVFAALFPDERTAETTSRR
jgi:probable rRNA maturation factor